MYKGLKIGLVIPAYNEEKLIGPTLEGVPDTIDKVYVVNDCSTDATKAIVEEFGNKDNRIELINNNPNKGVGQSIINGYMKAVEDDCDGVVVIGGDNQMDLQDLPNFLEPLYNKEADYIKGNRFLHGSAFKDMPSKRFFGNSTLSLITKWASGYWKIFDSQDGYTVITKEAIKKVNWDWAWKGYGYVGDWLVLFNVFNLKIKDVPRRAIYLEGERQSQIKIFRYILKVLPRMVGRFFWRLKMKYLYQDFHPLVLFYLFGLIVIPIGIVIGGLLIYQGIIGKASGNLAILSALLILSGFQSLFFAILFDMKQNEDIN